jgi:hypothetical protein
MGTAMRWRLRDEVLKIEADMRALQRARALGVE